MTVQANKSGVQQRGSALSAAGRVVSALKYPQYRRYWLGNLASVGALQVLTVAQGWLVYSLTGSPLYLGYIGLATAAPAIVFNLVGGVIADRLDMRRIIIATETIAAALMLLLGVLTASGLIQVWHVIATAFVMGLVSAFAMPGRMAIFPDLVDRKDLMNAVALNSVVWQSMRIVAPAVGGLVLRYAGTDTAFYVCAGGFLLMVFAMWGIKLPPADRQGKRNAVQDMLKGIEFIRSNSTFSFLIGMTFVNSFFGLSYLSLMPVFAKDILVVGEQGLGFLYSMGGLGGILGNLTVAALGNVLRKGWLIVIGATFYGAFIVLFSFSTFYPLSLSAVFLVGISASVYMVSTMTTLQMLVPDELRGRVMGIFSMNWNLAPLGAMQSGAIANVMGATWAVAIGGMAVAGFALGVASVNQRVRRLGTATG